MEYRVGVRKLERAKTLKKPNDAAELLGDLAKAEVEVMAVIHVTPEMKAVEVETAAVGSMMSVSVESRSIFRHAVSQGPRCLVVAHNHAFQRKPQPSDEDREFTSGIRAAGSLLGIPVMDAIVIGQEEYYSALEKGFTYAKASEYPGVARMEFFSTNGKLKSEKPDVITVMDPIPVAAPSKAVQYFDFLKKAKEEMTAVLHMTPDLEPTRIEVFPSDTGDHGKEEARNILRRAIEFPSTKYLIMANNHACFKDPMRDADRMLERIHQIRYGGMVLCIPVVDMIEIGTKGHYSFMEHGTLFPKSKFYSIVEAEVLRIKGPSKTRRPDIPPYAWTIR